MRPILRGVGTIGGRVGLLAAMTLLLLVGAVRECPSAEVAAEKWVLTSYETYDGHGYNTGGDRWPSGMPRRGEQGLTCSVTVDGRTYTNALAWTNPPQELTPGQTFTLEAQLENVALWGPINAWQGTAAGLNGGYIFDHFPSSIPAGTLTSVATGDLKCRMGSCGGLPHNQQISIPVTFKGCSSIDDCHLVWRVFGCQDSPDHYLWIKYGYTKARPDPTPPVSKRRVGCPKGEPTGRIQSINGDVEVRIWGEDWTGATVGMLLCMSDEIATGPESEVEIAYSDGSVVIVRPLTQIVVGTMQGESTSPKIQVLLKAGEVAAKVTQQKAWEADFSIQTPVATASVRGTIFTVRHDPVHRVTTVAVEEGLVRVAPATASLRTVDLRAGQQVQVTDQSVSAVTSVLAGATGLGGTTGPGGAQYIGCFRDAWSRALDGASWQDGAMTIERCIAFCAQRGFRYAGTQYASQCFCGNSYDRYGTDGATCDVRCAGNSAQICGGSWANSVYALGAPAAPNVP